MQLSKIDKVIIGISSLILIGSVKYLTISEEKVTIKEIYSVGKLNKLVNNVKKKRVDSVNWYSVHNGDSIIEKDFIFTGEDSFAKIIFNNGNSVSIEENSLIHLENYDDYPKIELNDGVILTNAKGLIEIKLKDQDKKIISDKGEFQVMMKNNKTEVNVFKGEITLRSKKKTENIKQGQTLVITKNNHQILTKKIIIKEVSVKNKVLNIEWSSKKNIKPLKLVLSKGYTFKKSTSVKVNSNTIKLPYLNSYKFFKLVSINEPTINSITYPILKKQDLNSLYSKRKQFSLTKTDPKKTIPTSNKNEKDSFLKTFKTSIVAPIQKIILNTKKDQEFKEKNKK